MKVGIITFHRAYNYGAVLQCYALQEVIRSMGHEVEVVDYRQTYIENRYSPQISLKEIISFLTGFHLRGLKHYIKKKRLLKKNRLLFSSFSNKFLNVSEPITGMGIPPVYNRYIIGSDQMWGIHCTGGYDSVYWGDFNRPIGSKLYGYAISTNLNYHDFLTDEEVKKAVDRFDGLSFREKAIRDDIERITGVKGVVCIDPTLLTDSSIWNPMINNSWSKKKYVALYLLRCKKDSGEDIRAKANVFARSHGCDVIDLTFMNYSVEDFVSIIKFAQCVFTTSFHATVFSIIFNRPFYSIKLNDGSDVRYENLLTQLGLTNHLFDWRQELLPIGTEDDAFLKIQLSKLQIASFDYLNNILR